MNGLERVQECVRNFICNKKQIKQQITEIEEKRTQLAQQRNEKKKFNIDWSEINELGKQISELGNQSQELQNNLDSNCLETKTQLNLVIDNLVVEGIRKIRKIEEETQQIETSINEQKERTAKYEVQKQEFFERFGRMPELSEKAIKENELQAKDSTKGELEISQLREQVSEIETNITELANIKRKIKNGDWDAIIENESDDEEFSVEEFNVEEMEPIEEIAIDEFEPIEEMYIEPFRAIEEIEIGENSPEEAKNESFENEEIEKLAKAIVEEIAASQIQNIEISKEPVLIEEDADENNEEDIIVFEKEDDEEETTQKEHVKIPLFVQRTTISNIIIKIEENELVYKAQMSDGKEIKIYPSKLGEESVLLRDKQNREDCKEILINYAVSEYKLFDKKAVNKIDPLICELLVECAERCDYNASELIYNYVMSFSNYEEIDEEKVPDIIYNLSYIEESNLKKKERSIINKICKNAKKNNKIEIIESFSGFNKIKYVFKRLFAINNVKVLPESKY